MIFKQILNSAMTKINFKFVLVLNKNSLAAQQLFYSKPISHIVKCM